MTIKIMGVDIGLNGAIAIGEGDINTKEFKIKEIKFFPTIEIKKNRRDYIPANLYDIIPNDIKLAIIEQPLAIPYQKVQTASSNFKCLGYLEMAMIAKKIAYQIISPAIWRKKLTIGISKTNTKTTAIIACKRLFPDVNLKKTEKSKKDDDNIAEAILLTYYGWLSIKW